MNIAFQVEVQTNSDGRREIVRVECDLTTDPPSDAIEVAELGGGAWEFSFVLCEDFDGTEPVFRRFSRYGLVDEDVMTACSKAMRTAA